MLDFRLREDQEKGTGYRGFCDSCGQTSLSSHALSYCPVCGRDKLILTPIVVNKIGEERKAYVTFNISGRFVTEVHCGEAVNVEKVIKKAVCQYGDADFGELSDINGEPVKVEDTNGNYLWEK